MSDFEAEFAALKAEYAASLPAKVDALDALLQAVTAGAPGALEELRSRSHRLRGSAGSYGFDRVSDAAGRLEDAIKEALAAGARPSLDQLGRCVMELRALSA